MRLAVMALGVVLVVTTASAEQSKRWLGIYKGSAIPGYIIGKAEYMGVSQSGSPTISIESYGVIQDLKDECVKSNGIALVNVSLFMAFGPMHRVDAYKGSNPDLIIEPASKEIYVSGDCVLGVVNNH